VPDLNEVNARLARRTGWAAVPVAGYLPPRPFFNSLAQRRFPTTTTVRPRAQLDYLPEPDIFHDVFGHVPLHADPTFAASLQRFGVLGLLAESEEQVEQVARFFWFTVEFGLVREAGAVKVFGSGLVSSHADAANALGPTCERRPFALDAVLAQSFAIDRLQEVLFVLDSFDQLWGAVGEMEARLRRA
jgi:phenylalanine-4-hydroxylase